MENNTPGQNKNKNHRRFKHTASITKKNRYESIFIRQAPVTGRQGKTTYIRKQFFCRIQQIISLYNNPDTSVYSYVDAVPEYHFEQYKQHIKELHDKLYTAPYE